MTCDGHWYGMYYKVQDYDGLPGDMISEIMKSAISYR